MGAHKAASFGARVSVGRLIEAHLDWVNDADDVRRFQETIARAFAQAGPHAVICADWRGVEVLGPAASDAVLELLRMGNARFDRSAVLLAPGKATFVLQVERLFRTANNDARRAFRSPASMLEWLAEVLDEHELARATRFVTDRR